MIIEITNKTYILMLIDTVIVILYTKYDFTIIIIY